MFSLAINGEKVLHTIAAKDITRTAADLLLDDSWGGGGSTNLVGPDKLTPDETAQIISKISGKPVVFQQTRFEDYQTNLMRFGMSEVWAKGV